MKEKIKNFTGILQYKYNKGESLRDIYKQVYSIHGHLYTPATFGEFCRINKNNKKFMEEFNKTCFIG